MEKGKTLSDGLTQEIIDKVHKVNNIGKDQESAQAERKMVKNN